VDLVVAAKDSPRCACTSNQQGCHGTRVHRAPVNGAHALTCLLHTATRLKACAPACPHLEFLLHASKLLLRGLGLLVVRLELLALIRQLGLKFLGLLLQLAQVLLRSVDVRVSAAHQRARQHMCTAARSTSMHTFRRVAPGQAQVAAWCSMGALSWEPGPLQFQ